MKTLSALVHASPRLHAVYSVVRESVLTEAILRELATKDSPLDVKAFFKPTAVYRLFTINQTLDPNLPPAVKIVPNTQQRGRRHRAECQSVRRPSHRSLLLRVISSRR